AAEERRLRIEELRLRVEERRLRTEALRHENLIEQAEQAEAEDEAEPAEEDTRVLARRDRVKLTDAQRAKVKPNHRSELLHSAWSAEDLAEAPRRDAENRARETADRLQMQSVGNAAQP